jgi:hypothetical protein
MRDDDWFTRLNRTERGLLDRLAAGMTLVAAAPAEYLSLRTANRRMAELRRRSGTRTTKEVVALYRERMLAGLDDELDAAVDCPVLR